MPESRKERMRPTNLDFSKYIAERTLTITIPITLPAGFDINKTGFVGREWIFAKIDEWLANPDAPRYLIITGEPGIGKTSFAAQMTKGDDLAAVHFCVQRHADTVDPLNFVRSISSQLTRFDGFAKGILKGSDISLQGEQNIQENYGLAINVKIENLVINAASAGTAFIHTVVEPLKALYGGNFNQQLLILVDALDEAVQKRGSETILDLLANAQGLPPQVRFVLTARPESAVLRHFEQVGQLLTINAEGENNRDDILAYVRSWLANSSLLSKQIIEQNVSFDNFVNRIVDASQGNFLYLTWLLPMMEQQVQNTEAFPVGLEGIYREFLRTRSLGSDINQWRNYYRPLLGILAASQAPITKQQLGHLVKLSEQQIDDFLVDVQQFLDPSEYGQARLQLYHQSIVDFLSSKEKAQEFWIQLTLVHRTIADYYLEAWGGLENSLPELQQPERRDIDHQYGLRYIASHLAMANRSKDLHQLLRLEKRIDERVENLWFVTKEAVGDLAGYLTDVNYARQILQSNDGNDSVDQLTLEYRYLLILTSINSLATNLPPVLLINLVAKGIWQPVLGLIYAQRILNDRQRAETLASLIPYLSNTANNQAQKALEEALTTLKVIEDEFARANILEMLVPHLPYSLIDDVLTMTQALKSKADQVAILTEVSLRLAKLGYPDRALGLINRMVSRTDQVFALIAIAACLPNTLQKQVLQQAEKSARRILFREVQSKALVDIALHLPEQRRQQLLREAFKVAQEIKVKIARVESLSYLIPYLSGSEQSEVLSEVLEAVQIVHGNDKEIRMLQKLVPLLAQMGYSEEPLRAAKQVVNDKQLKVELMISLIIHLPEPLKNEVLNEALAEARKFTQYQTRVELLAKLASHLSEPVKQRIERETLSTLKSLKNTKARNSCLEKIAPHLSAALLQEVLTWTRVIRDGEVEAQVQVQVSPARVFTEPDKLDTRNQEIIHAPTNKIFYKNFQPLSDQLTELERLNLNDIPLEILWPGPDSARYNKEKHKDLLSMPKHLLVEDKSSDQVLRVLLMGANVHDYDLPPDYKELKNRKHSELMEPDTYDFVLPSEKDTKNWKYTDFLEKLQRAALIFDDVEQDILETRIELFLPGSKSESSYISVSVQEVKAALRRLADSRARVRVLMWLLTTAPESLQSFIIQEINKEVSRTANHSEIQVKVLIWVAIHLPELFRMQILQLALLKLNNIADKERQAILLVWLRNYLPEQLIANELYRAWVTVYSSNNPILPLWLVAFLPPSLKAQALIKALEITKIIVDKQAKGEALVWLLSNSPEPLKSEALDSLLEVLRTISDEKYVAAALMQLASRLEEPFSLKVFAIAQTINHALLRTKTFIKLAPYLSARERIEALRKALLITLTLDGSSVRADLLTELTSYLLELPRLPLYSICIETLHHLSTYGRERVLSDLQILTPVVTELGGTQAENEMVQAIQDVTRWWP